mmetsp:Transcript_110539/g.319404  ORF Transcript_110539/g.319404 Transcript_110539/m.319404 type:complete len:155 (-) Transcript_110539:1577-2041(-)
MLPTMIRTSLAASRRCASPATTDITSRYFGSVKKKEKKSKGDTSRPRDLEVILSALDAPVIKPPPADKEEIERREKIHKAYTIGKFKEHNDENHDIACKLKMKQHALNMLPRSTKLKEKALEVDNKGPPRWRRIPSWTPPIPGFDPNQFTLTEE